MALIREGVSLIVTVKMKDTHAIRGMFLIVDLVRIPTPNPYLAVIPYSSSSSS